MGGGEVVRERRGWWQGRGVGARRAPGQHTLAIPVTWLPLQPGTPWSATPRPRTRNAFHPAQLSVTRDDVRVTEADLLTVPTGPRTLATLRHNVDVGVRYTEAWLGGLGCVPLYNLMEDAATAEICRTQVWQWLRHGATLDDGKPLTVDRFNAIMDEEMAKAGREQDGVVVGCRTGFGGGGVVVACAKPADAGLAPARPPRP